MLPLESSADFGISDVTRYLLAAGEMLHIAEPFLERNLHPTVIVRGFMHALEDAISIVDKLAFPIDTQDREQMLKIVNSCIGTKYTARFGTLMAVSACHCHSAIFIMSKVSIHHRMDDL